MRQVDKTDEVEFNRFGIFIDGYIPDTLLHDGAEESIRLEDQMTAQRYPSSLTNPEVTMSTAAEDGNEGTKWDWGSKTFLGD
ncbi:hypothetical protein TcWFU_001823 [Taenia crassiceps]|uniref:Uncharacterized protein n=1 Tax=Taenia crassiceps TaxID=6207 RepID=A0ABR4Q333_9CEST